VRIHHLNCGSIAPPGARLVNGTGSLLRRGTIVCHCLLVVTDAGLVLVDTGIGLHDVARPVARLGRPFLWALQPRLEPAETAVRQIAALGYQSTDVRHVVLTHLDVDHAGGLADFPQAQVHVHATELAAALHPTTLLVVRV
jgi:glyoxylase-like metal-dependent hydrolase (beta-lactamase superfamily II)